MKKTSKLKKYLFEVEFVYFKGDEPEELKFIESFYETNSSLETVVDTIERVKLRLGHKLMYAKIKKVS